MRVSELLIQGGSTAALNGKEAEGLIRSVLINKGLRYNPHAKSIIGLCENRHMLFDDKAIGEFGTQCDVPLVGPAHDGRKRKATIDFVLTNHNSDPVLLSVKSQRSDGSVEQKLWFEIQQLIDTQIPSAILVYGPTSTAKREGWKLDFLREIWDLTRYNGKNIFLFRGLGKFERWIDDGFPIPGKIQTHASIFQKYCDAEPY